MWGLTKVNKYEIMYLADLAVPQESFLVREMVMTTQNTTTAVSGASGSQSNKVKLRQYTEEEQKMNKFPLFHVMKAECPYCGAKNVTVITKSDRVVLQAHHLYFGDHKGKDNNRCIAAGKSVSQLNAWMQGKKSEMDSDAPPYVGHVAVA